MSLVTALGLSCATTIPIIAEDCPNIVFILVDDVSWSDFACYGHEQHETPNIDRLADEGVRFTQAYAPAPICSASRAAILTGKFPARLHFEFVTKNEKGKQRMNVPLQSPPFTLNLPLSERAIAELLSESGYATGFFGKWHLNQHHGGYLGWSPTHSPLQQGFHVGDSDFGCHPYSYRKRPDLRESKVPRGEFPQDTLTDKAINFIDRHSKENFFLYLSHYFVHDPVHSRCEWLIEKHMESYLRKNGDSQPTKLLRKRAEYAAMIETLDHMIGRLLKKLDDSKLTDQTMIVLMSDNGGHPNYTTNAPLRGSKWNLYEGGIRVPMIVRWPNGIEGGQTCGQAVHGCDLLPTFSAAAGISKLPEDVDGTNLMPLLRDPTVEMKRRALIWHFPYYHPERTFDKAPAKIGIGDFVTSQTRPVSAIRHGKWKLIRFYEDQRHELYDLSLDPGEQKNLNAANPEKAAELQRLLDDSLKRTQARFPTRKKKE